MDALCWNMEGIWWDMWEYVETCNNNVGTRKDAQKHVKIRMAFVGIRKNRWEYIGICENVK